MMIKLALAFLAGVAIRHFWVQINEKATELYTKWK